VEVTAVGEGVEAVVRVEAAHRRGSPPSWRPPTVAVVEAARRRGGRWRPPAVAVVEAARRRGGRPPPWSGVRRRI
jgi:hypothetical protein